MSSSEIAVSDNTIIFGFTSNGGSKAVIAVVPLRSRTSAPRREEAACAAAAAAAAAAAMMTATTWRRWHAREEATRRAAAHTSAPARDQRRGVASSIGPNSNPSPLGPNEVGGVPTWLSWHSPLLHPPPSRCGVPPHGHAVGRSAARGVGPGRSLLLRGHLRAGRAR